MYFKSLLKCHFFSESFTETLSDHVFETCNPPPLVLLYLVSLLYCFLQHVPLFDGHFTHSLEKEMTAHSRILAWRIPWAEEPDGLQSVESQRVSHD